MCGDGQDLARDDSDAAQWQKAAILDYAAAQNRLGCAYLKTKKLLRN